MLLLLVNFQAIEYSTKGLLIPSLFYIILQFISVLYIFFFLKFI